MDRRTFLQTAGTAGLATDLAPTAAQAYIPEHNWEKYDWGAARCTFVSAAIDLNLHA
jgi:hypothetical protein